MDKLAKTKVEQCEIIMDYIYEEDNLCFSIHDYSFLTYWENKTNGMSDVALKHRINELIEYGRLDKTRKYNENTRPSGIPRWFYVYS